jgi:hypothetical protein
MQKHYYAEAVKISDKLRVAIFLDHRPAYLIAQAAGLHPSVLSKILNGIERVSPGDERVLRVAKIVGLQEVECFESEGDLTMQPRLDSPNQTVNHRAIKKDTGAIDV